MMFKITTPIDDEVRLSCTNSYKIKKWESSNVIDQLRVVMVQNLQRNYMLNHSHQKKLYRLLVVTL